jgi:hypothetical protein
MTAPKVAVITAEPCVFEVARPVALMVATDELADAQVTVLLMSLVLESEYDPIALNWAAKPAATEVGVALTEMDCSVGCGGVGCEGVG